ncbi:RNA polymerase Rpb4 family protein [Candidatus Bathyarchaeota archaeon]|nr:RNA polymerase Rpb4 family protein [Candidatus Bathyarchaeota archaeon]
MSKETATERKLTLPNVKKTLDSIGEENLDQLQRRTLDYVAKFAKVDADAADKIVERLVNEFGLDENEAIQVVNCMPRTVDELRVFLAGGRKIIDVSTLKAIIGLLDEHRKLK